MKKKTVNNFMAPLALQGTEKSPHPQCRTFGRTMMMFELSLLLLVYM